MSDRPSATRLATGLLPAPRSQRTTAEPLLLLGPFELRGLDPESGGGLLLRRALDRKGIPHDWEPEAILDAKTDASLPAEGYRIEIEPGTVRIAYANYRGSVHACATLSQLILEAPTTIDGVELPGLTIEDEPKLARRGVMLDVSRDRVPTMATLERLIELFANWKLNELQLYTEHTFAFAGHEDVWRGKDPLTPDEIRRLDALCRNFGIELVPNQQSFGHLHRWLTLPRYRDLAECPEGLEHPFSPNAEPFSLCPEDPGSLALLEDLFAQLLPCFSSGEFHVGLDETFDLGEGRSREACAEKGIGRVHMDFLRAVNERVRAHGKRMWFWADIVLNHPEVLKDLPEEVVACSWGYEAGHDFDGELGRLKQHGIAHVACPGTTSWKSFVGRPANMIANVAEAAQAAARHDGLGLLMTDWGDQGHLQPLPASYFGWAAAASAGWNPERPLSKLELETPVDRDAFEGGTGLANALWELGRLGEDVGSIPNATVPFQVAMRPDIFPPERAEPAPTESAFQQALEISEQIELPPRTPRTALHHDELSWAKGVLEFACRLGCIRSRTPEAPIESLPRVDRARLALELAGLTAEHRRLWPLRTRLGGLEDSARWLESLLDRLKA